MLVSMRTHPGKCVIKEGKEWLAGQQSLKGCLEQEQG